MLDNKNLKILFSKKKFPLYRNKPVYSSIYFLVKEDSLVYVGLTEDLVSKRVLSHTYYSNKQFDSYYHFILSNELSKKTRIAIEYIFIAALQPFYNRDLKLIYTHGISSKRISLVENLIGSNIPFRDWGAEYSKNNNPMLTDKISLELRNFISLKFNFQFPFSRVYNFVK